MKTLVYILAVVTALACLLFSPFLFAALGNEMPIGLEEAQSTSELIEMNWLTEMGMPALTAVLIFAIGYFIRRLRNIPNVWLSVLLPLGTIFYCVVGDDASDVASKNVALKTAYGLIISILSVLAVIVAHDKIMMFAAKRFPLLSILVSDPPASEPPKPEV